MGYEIYYDGEAKITPDITDEHIALFNMVTKTTPTDPAALDIFNKIGGRNMPSCQFFVAEDRVLYAREGELRGVAEEWLEGLIEHFFKPNGYVLEGQFTWSGEDVGDTGAIYVKDNKIETVQDIVCNEGPSWNRSRYFSKEIRDAISAVVDSADNTGCDGDLTVVSKNAINRLSEMVNESNA